MKRLNKKTGIAIFTAVMAILAVIILVYHNPLANPQDELLKKVIACVLIVAAVIAFIRLYDKITVLPMELYQKHTPAGRRGSTVCAVPDSGTGALVLFF